MCSVEIKEKEVEMIVDSGASLNLIDKNTFKGLYEDKKKATKNTKRRIFSYGTRKPLPLRGTVRAQIYANANSTVKATLFTVRGCSGNLLGYTDTEQL